MLQEEKQKALRLIERKILVTGILDTPGAIMIALWASAKFSHGEPFLLALKNETVLDALLVIGGAIMCLCMLRIVSLLAEKKKILEKEPI